MRVAAWRRLAVMGLLLGLGAVFLVYPIWLTVRGGFVVDPAGVESEFTLHHVLAVFRDPRLLAGLVNALLIASATTLLCLLFALPLGVLAARYEFPGKAILSALLLVPLVLPPFVGAIGVRHLLGRFGTINTILTDLGLAETGIDFIGRGGFWAIVVVEALHLYPILYLNATAALANLDPSLEEAAENLGAGRWTRFRRIVLPLIRPGLFAGATIVFIWSFTELGTPLMFEFHRVTPVQIFNGIKEMDASAEPYALTAVMLVVAAALYLLGKRLFGGRAYAMYGKATVAATTRRLGPLPGAAVTAFFVLIVALAALPHLGVVLASLSSPGGWYRTILPAEFTLAHYEAAMSHPLAVGSIRNSLFYASAAVAIDVLVGLAVAWLLVRTTTPGRRLLDTMAMMPLAVPGLVLAFGYVAMTLRWPFREGDPLAGWADVLGADPNPVLLLIVAYAVRRLPYVVRACAAGLEQTSRELEEAALNLGATRATTLRRVTVPLIAANLIAGGLLAFSFAMLEVSDSLILAQREEHFPITKAIYVLFERLGDGPYLASAMGVWGMALLTLTLLGASAMLGRKMGAIFRV